MKRLFRWTIRVAAVGAILCVVLFLLKDAVLKAYLEHRLTKDTGMKAKIEKLHWEAGRHTISIRNLKLYNAPAFGGNPFLDIPEVNLEFVRSDLASGKLHLKDLRFHVAEVHIVKNRDGKSNVTFEEEGGPSTEQRAKKSKPLLEFAGIDKLHLSVGKVFYTDMQDAANNSQYDLGVRDEIIRDIKTESDLTDWLLNYLVKREMGGQPLSVKLDPTNKHQRTNVTSGAEGTNRSAQPTKTPGEKR